MMLAPPIERPVMPLIAPMCPGADVRGPVRSSRPLRGALINTRENADAGIGLRLAPSAVAAAARKPR